MDNFKSRTMEFRLNEPDTYARNLRGATIGQCDEQYLFMLCAYDYVYNPDTLDQKLKFMLNYFFWMPEKTGRNDPLGVAWYLNIGSPHKERIDALLVNPTVTVSIENKAFNAVPAPKGAMVTKSAATGNPTFEAPKALNGGVILGGVGNYNLFTKAIDIACAAIGNMNLSIATAIKTNRDRTLSGIQRQLLAHRYEAMHLFYSDQVLTRFGLIYR